MGYSLQIVLVTIFLMRCSLTVQNILYSSFIQWKGAKTCDRDNYRGIVMFSVFAKFLK